MLSLCLGHSEVGGRRSGARWKASHGGGLGVLSLCTGLRPLGMCTVEGEEAGNAGESWEGGAELDSYLISGTSGGFCSGP